MPERHLPSGTVSLLFTDIEGSTELLKQLGDQAYAEVLSRHAALMREAFRGEDGTEVDTQGDAFFVAFPRAAGAVAAAAAAQRALAAERWPEGATLRVRMGVHTGEPTRGGHGYVGLDVNRGARIAASGHGGQVLLSERAFAMARAQLPDGVAVLDLGEHRLKDLPQPEHIFQLEIAGLPSAFPRLKTLDVLVTNLPDLQLTSFVGREREMEEITRSLTQTRLLTMTGPGGTGKTRLSLQVASALQADFPKGVWLVELASLTDGTLLPQTVAAIFGLRELPGRPIVDSLIDYLRPRRLLLLLDNCEHLIGAAAQLAAALLRGCPELSILTTSREPLNVPGEALYAVPPLSRPAADRISSARLADFESTRLFLERAAAANLRFAVTEAGAAAIARIARRLDGIPLAIELAAARVKVLTPEQIAARLDDRFRLLTGGARTGLSHHQTLRATVDWSYDLLPPLERTLLQRVSVFAGGFDLEAAETVCAGEPITAEDVLDLLSHLVDKSLTVAEGSNGSVRYRMLETIRLYGRGRLQDEGGEDALRKRHLEWCRDLAEGAEPRLLGPDQTVWLDRLELDHDDLRLALAWSQGSAGDRGAGLRLAAALTRFWSLRGYLGEGRTWLAPLLAYQGPAASARAKGLYGAASLAFYQGDYRQAASLSAEALRLYRELGDPRGVAISLNMVGVVARNTGDYGRAAVVLDESIGVARRLEDRWPLAEALTLLGVTVRRQGDYDRARGLGAESLALWREVGDKSGLAAVLAHLGVVTRYQGDYERAKAYHEESLALRRELGDRVDLATSLGSLGTVAMNLGEDDRAQSLFEESLSLCREIGNKVGTAAALGNLGVLASRGGDNDRAAAWLAESIELWRALGDRQGIATALTVSGMVAAAQGDAARAVALFSESLALYRELTDRLGTAQTLPRLARVLTEQGQAEKAIRLFGAAEALREAIAAPLPPSDRAEYHRAVAAARADLGDEAFLNAWALGRTMTFQDAIAVALNEA